MRTSPSTSAPSTTAALTPSPNGSHLRLPTSSSRALDPCGAPPRSPYRGQSDDDRRNAPGAEVSVLARTVRTFPAGPMTGMIAQVMLIAALAEIIALSDVGLGAAGWVVGITCGVVMNVGLARGLSHYRSARLC